MKKENLDISCTNIDMYDVNKKNFYKNYFIIPFELINHKILFYKNLIATSSVIMTKKLFNKVNGFPESKYFYSFEDYFFWLKVLENNKIRFIDKSLLIYQIDRINSASSRSKHIVDQRLRIFLYYLSEFNLKLILNIIIGNLSLLKNWCIRKIFKLAKNEYIDLL